MSKVMVVEDDNSLREIYTDSLQAEGYEVVSAADGEEALATAVKEKPDLIVLDVMMPKISGFDVLDILRSTPETKGAHIMMMTALSQQSDKQRGERLGADRYLVKSQVTVPDIVENVRELLEEGPSQTQSSPQPQGPQAPPMNVPNLPVDDVDTQATTTQDNTQQDQPQTELNQHSTSSPVQAGTASSQVQPSSTAPPQQPATQPQPTPPAANLTQAANDSQQSDTPIDQPPPMSDGPSRPKKTATSDDGGNNQIGSTDSSTPTPPSSPQTAPTPEQPQTMQATPSQTPQAPQTDTSGPKTTPEPESQVEASTSTPSPAPQATPQPTPQPEKTLDDIQQQPPTPKPNLPTQMWTLLVQQSKTWQSQPSKRIRKSNNKLANLQPSHYQSPLSQHHQAATQ